MCYKSVKMELDFSCFNVQSSVLNIWVVDMISTIQFDTDVCCLRDKLYELLTNNKAALRAQNFAKLT